LSKLVIRGFDHLRRQGFVRNGKGGDAGVARGIF
jgi:hypothetical protein